MPSVQMNLLSNPLPVSQLSNGKQFQAKPGAQSTSEVAKDFESVFMSMMLKEMRNSLQPGSLFGEDSNDVYGGLFDQFLGQHMADAGGLGMAKMIQDALDRHSQNVLSTSTVVPKAQ